MFKSSTQKKKEMKLKKKKKTYMYLETEYYLQDIQHNISRTWVFLERVVLTLWWSIVLYHPEIAEPYWTQACPTRNHFE